MCITSRHRGMHGEAASRQEDECSSSAGGWVNELSKQNSEQANQLASKQAGAKASRSISSSFQRWARGPGGRACTHTSKAPSFICIIVPSPCLALILNKTSLRTRARACGTHVAVFKSMVLLSVRSWRAREHGS